MTLKESIPLWSLADPMTVEQAAALIAGFDPNAVRFNMNEAAYFENETGLTDSDNINWVQTAYAALKNAINGRKLKAQLRYSAEPGYVAGLDNLEERGRWNGEDVREIKDFDDSSYVITPVPAWGETLLGRDDLRAWLVSNGIHTGFFFPDSTNAPDYLDPKNPRYAPKLAAAVTAWLAVIDPGKVNPKKALEKWLREHAAEFGMTDDDGNPVNQAIDDCSKVANWQLSGGAPRTPSDNLHTP
jgi:hypothetical protein